MNIARDEEELDWMGGNCWFCGQRPPAHGKSCFVKMKKFADGPGNTVKILRSQVAVPRCPECAAGHTRQIKIALNAGCAGVVAVFLVVVVWHPIEMSGWLKALLVFLGFLPGALFIGGTAGLPEGQKPQSTAEGHRAVEAMRAGGWTKDE